jgi:hypothetical protein
VRAELVRHRAALAACLSKDLPAVRISVAIDAAKVVRVKTTAKTEVPASVQQCLVAAVQKIRFSVAGVTVSYDVAR